MQPGDREQAPTIAEAVTQAAAACDPPGADPAVRGLVRSFEDDDRPATAAEDLRAELLSTVRGIDPEGDSPAAELTAAAAVWLSTDPGAAEDHERLLRESSRLAFGDDPPDGVVALLAERGLTAG